MFTQDWKPKAPTERGARSERSAASSTLEYKPAPIPSYSAGSKGRYHQEAPLEMLTPVQQHAVDQFAKSLPALGDDALIDTYHQAWEDHREAVPRAATISTRPTQRVLRPKRRCRIASLITKAVTGYGIREPACPPGRSSQSRISRLDRNRRRRSNQIRIRLRLEHYLTGRTAEHNHFR